MNDNVKIKTLKVGDLVIWLPDGDIGVVVEVDEFEVANQRADRMLMDTSLIIFNGSSMRILADGMIIILCLNCFPLSNWCL